MADLQYILGKLLLVSEVSAGIVGIIKFRKFKNSYWKWFIYYLAFIGFSELVCEFVLIRFPKFLPYYYDYFIIPLEFVMMYWLYSYKSLQNKKLFWVSSLVYLVSLFAFKVTIVNHFNYIIGTFLLSIMIILEYNKQMKSDDILKFKENMMFYINTGVGLFYIGTLPYFAFNSLLWKDQVIFFNYYYIFLSCGILMYTLFSISLLWGKPNTY